MKQASQPADDNPALGRVIARLTDQVHDQVCDCDDVDHITSLWDAGVWLCLLAHRSGKLPVLIRDTELEMLNQSWEVEQ